MRSSRVSARPSHSTGPALASLGPLLERIRSLGSAAKPFSGNLAELFSSLRSTGGLERLLDLIFLGAGTTNGYDALGHFLRAEGVANLCLSYQLTANGNCDGKLFNTSGLGGSSTSSTSASTASRAAQNSTTQVLARTLAELGGATPSQALAKYPGSAPSEAELVGGGANAASSASTTSGTVAEGPGRMLLNYLLGE